MGFTGWLRSSGMNRGKLKDRFACAESLAAITPAKLIEWQASTEQSATGLAKHSGDSLRCEIEQSVGHFSARKPYK